MLPAPHAHLQSVFVVIILSHDGRLKGILSLLSRQHHQRSHGQGCSLQPDARQVLSRLNVQVRLFTRNGMLRYIPILVTICTWRQRSRHCGRDSLSLQDILSGIRNVRLNANRMIFESVILFFHHK